MATKKKTQAKKIVLKKTVKKVVQKAAVKPKLTLEQHLAHLMDMVDIVNQSRSTEFNALIVTRVGAGVALEAVSLETNSYITLKTAGFMTPTIVEQVGELVEAYEEELEGIKQGNLDQNKEIQRILEGK